MLKSIPRALVAVVAAALLSGCGSSLEPPAAVVNGHVISQAELAKAIRVSLTNPNTANQVASQGSSGMRSFVRGQLEWLVIVELARTYAAGHGIRVSPAEVSGQLAQIETNFGGPSQFSRTLAARGLTLSDARTTIARDLLVRNVEQSLIASARSGPTQSQQAILGQWLKERSEASTIRVNPRFGAFDAKRGFIVPLDSTALLPG